MERVRCGLVTAGCVAPAFAPTYVLEPRRRGYAVDAHADSHDEREIQHAVRRFARFGMRVRFRVLGRADGK